MKRSIKGKLYMKLGPIAKCSTRKLDIMELLVKSAEHFPTYQFMPTSVSPKINNIAHAWSVLSPGFNQGIPGPFGELPPFLSFKLQTKCPLALFKIHKSGSRKKKKVGKF